jgi:ATP-binding cassette subfamily B protein
LQQERPGLTILTVAHRPAAVRQAQNIILLDRGRIMDQGTFDELETRTPLFRSLVQSTDAA